MYNNSKKKVIVQQKIGHNAHMTKATKLGGEVSVKSNVKIVEFKFFNPYEARIPEKNIVSRECVIFAKRLRKEGYNVNIKSTGSDRVYYTFRKGLSEILSDPVVIFFINIPITIVIGLVTSWLNDLKKHNKFKKEIPDNLNIAIEVENDGNKIRYDHKGREISDERFNQLISLMKQNKDAYTNTLAVIPPYPDLPYPVTLEHTNQIVGWANIKYIENKGLIANPVKIINNEVLEMYKKGELTGFSIAGIVGESICNICGRNYLDCNHDADSNEKVVKELKNIKLAEISIVKDPVNIRCRIQED